MKSIWWKTPGSGMLMVIGENEIIIFKGTCIFLAFGDLKNFGDSEGTD